MKKSLYIAAFAALALTACSDNSNEIFDQSAAERLEQYKQEYREVLTENGGMWTMEYFSNPEEPGYLFIMKFGADGSVTIGANHKWIGNEYKQETSIWRMIADNGPVLSFDSYNSLFHIFSDPANITGPDAPKGEDDEDIDETGYGHEGDYEFQVLEVSEDRNTIRLLGKKRLYHIYMRRLDPNTDMQKYMDDYKKIESSLFCKEISNLLFTDADGERYVVTGAHTGVMSIYPEAGDPVDQVRTGNFIITNSGIRFMNPLEYENAAGDERKMEELNFVGNYSLALVDNENAVLNAGTFEEFMYNNTRSWKVDIKSITGSVKDAFDSFNSQLKTLYNYKSAGLNDLTIEYDEMSKSYILKFYIRISAKGYETDRYYVTFSDDQGKAKFSIGEAFDNGSQLALNAYSELGNLFNMLGSSHPYSVVSECGPKNITLSIGDGSLTMNAL